MATEPLFDWRAFLEENNVEHRLHLGRGWAEIRCPFCGDADRGMHLGVRLDPASPGWSCWKDYSHRGRRPEKLLQALTGCSRVEAAGIVVRQGLEQPQFTPETGLGTPQTGEGVHSQRPPPNGLVWPPEMRLLEGAYVMPFLRYLVDRGFSEPQRVVSEYRLRGCVAGPFQWRLIIPVFDAVGNLLTWTGRSIKSGITPKYRSLSHRPYPNQPQAVLNIKEVIYNLQFLRGGGRVLVITEGPLDAIKVDHSCYARGVRATCLFGKVASPQQLAALSAAAPAFDRVVVLLDADALSDAWRLADELRSVCRTPVDVGALPAGVKDPGELDEDQLREMFQ